MMEKSSLNLLSKDLYYIVVLHIIMITHQCEGHTPIL